MEKTLELYKEEYDKTVVGLDKLKKDLQQQQQEEAKIRQSIQTLEKTSSSIIKKIKKLKKTYSAPLGTDDIVKVKALTLSYLFKYSEDNEPMFVYLDYDDDDVKSYLTPCGVFFTRCDDEESISFSFYKWDGENLEHWCRYDNDWQAPDNDDEDMKKLEEKIYKYTIEQKVTEAMEKALEIE